MISCQDMPYTLEKIKKSLALPASSVVEFPPSEIEADLAIPSFKTLSAGGPQKLAKKINALRCRYISKVDVVGGYVNVTLNKDKLAGDVLKEIKKYKDKYGWKRGAKKVFIEYSSPNIAKPLHIGHLRNTVLGMALKNIYQANGYKVITENWLGDWGKQYGLLILAHQKWPKLAYDKLYVRAAKEAEKNKKFDEQAKEIFQKIENGDKKLLALWKKFRKIGIKDFKKTYKALGATFDLWLGESFYVPLIPSLIKSLLKKNFIEKDGQAVVVDLTKYGLQSYLLIKGDGASLYSARDLAAAKYRLAKYKPEKIIYIVGHEQEFYLRQIFKTLELMGYKKNKLQHISYGIVTLTGKKMSTRAGNIITLDDVLDKAIKKAGNREMGVGAIIYSMFLQSNKKNISFNLKSALNLQGNSAPYIQYGYVRARSILKKARAKNLKVPRSIKLNEREGRLVMLLARFPELIREAGEFNEPHLIADYLNNLVQEFNRFYTQDSVLNADGDIKSLRLSLVDAVSQVIKNGLKLLGVGVPTKM